jgi:hypothetical protein
MPLRAIQGADRVCDLARVLATEAPRLVRDEGDVRITVFRAKAGPDSGWASHALHALVAEARDSYRAQYGQHVSIFDRYDGKAWVYAAIAGYDSDGTHFDEALTLRFVPATGAPARNDDLNFYTCEAAPGGELAELLTGAGRHRRLGIGSDSHAYSQSRMGSIRPRAHGGRQLSGNRHVGLAWCLMLECFLADTANADRACRVLTAQTTDQLRTLGARVPMLPADRALGLEPGSIRLDRRAPHVRDLCYGVPLYFLNLKDVGALLSRLLAEGWLSASALRRAVTPGVELAQALSRPRASALAGLHLLFDAQGAIDGSRLTGEGLRELADAEVRDGPVLRLTQLDALELELAKLRPTAHRPSSIVLRPRAEAR